MLTPVRFGIVLGLSLFLFACGGGGGNNNTVAQIEVTPAQANLTPGERVQFTAVAKTASGNVVDGVPFTWRSEDPSVATIDANGVATGNAIGVTGVVASSGPLGGSAIAGVVGPGKGSSNLSISGKAQYEDRPFDEKGFTGALDPAPIRGTIIHLIAIDGFVTLDTGATADDGTFTFTGIDNTPRRAGLYLQVLSKTDPANPTQVEIRDHPQDRALFAQISSPLDDSATASFPGRAILASAAGIGGAFNSLDVFSRADELIRNAGACNTPSVASSTSPCVPPLLTAYWEPGSSTGTFYDNSQDAIFILGGGTAAGDTDEYDDSVIAHEYGHFIVAHFSHDDSPGGIHTITDNAEDLRLAYSEGWGNFFSSAVRNSPLYVDTANQGTFSFELETLTSPGAPNLRGIAIHDTHELAVAAVLWDIFDAPPLDDDPLTPGFAPIWQTVLQIPATSTATFESFWLTFKEQNAPSAADLQTIMVEREIELFPDPTAPAALTPNSAAEHRTLYKGGPDPTGDEDVIPLQGLAPGVSYTVQTLNLINGADTLLFITDAADPSNAPLFQNDNRNNVNYQKCDSMGPRDGQGTSNCPPNDGRILSSSVTFIAPSAGPFNAHVKHSPAAPPSAGLFGSYDIQLKSP